jgi:hypothetical protein
MEEIESGTCKTICAWCGELVNVGAATEGNELFMAHLAESHPEKYAGIAEREAKRRERVKAMLRGAIKPGTPSGFLPIRQELWQNGLMGSSHDRNHG